MINNPTTKSKQLVSQKIREEPESASIVSIQIQKLFGEFTYTIPSSGRVSEENLIILYGDNGSGKTTLLKLLVHMLSPEPFEGHRTAIGDTPFKSFSIQLSNGTKIAAERYSDKLIGDYTLTITKDDEVIVRYIWIPKESRTRESDVPSTPDNLYHEYCSTLAKLGIRIHFLSDSRKVQSFQRASRNRPYSELAQMVRATGEFFPHDEAEESWLQDAIKNALQTVRSMALAGTNRGYESANQIYKDIVKRLVQESDPTSKEPEGIRSELRQRFQVLGERNSFYARFGMTPVFEVKDLEGLLEKATSDTIPLLDRILSPYLDGVQARLDALEEAQKIASSFSRLMSEFYHGKIVVLHLSEGISIETTREQRLRPEDLSSGEQQLMLLMCNAITARRGSVVFAIDEPELSLNVKWQRKLIDALTELLSGSRCQLILATHSIELLAKYSGNVSHLKDETCHE